LDEVKELYKAIKEEEVNGKEESKSRNILYLTENALKAGTYTRPNSLLKGQKKIHTRKVERWDNLKQAMIHIGKCDSYKDLLLKLPKEIESIVSYDKISIVLINPDIQHEFEIEDTGKLRKRDMVYKKVFHNGTWFHVLHLISCPYSELQFKSKADLLFSKKKYFYIKH